MSERPLIDHGTMGGYLAGCKCSPCLAAKKAKSQAEGARRKARAAADPSVVPHGTVSGYRNWGCRCDPCCLAGRAASAKSRVRWTSTKGEKRYCTPIAPPGSDRG